MTETAEEGPAPRLCEIRKAYPEQEYGFNLHAERGKGQFIGQVDPQSPAHAAGLKAGDRIVAVNQHLIQQDSHKQVVSRIKENPLACVLLVIEEEGEAWYRQRQIPITLDQANIRRGDLHQQTEQRAKQPVPVAVPSVPSPVSVPVEPVPPAEEAEAPEVRPRPRECVLAKQSPGDEYGFNLHADRNKGHFIGGVDAGSLAEAAGLEEGQRIVGVNGVLIFPSSPHKDVVALIKQEPFRTQLLVASPEVDAFFRANARQFDFRDAEVARTDGGRLAQSPLLASPHSHAPAQTDAQPPPAPALHTNGNTNGNGHVHQEESSSVGSVGERRSPESSRHSRSKEGRDGSPESASSRSVGGSSSLSSAAPVASVATSSSVAGGPPSPAPVGDPALDAVFGMSAAELRAKLAANKRRSGQPIKSSGLSIQEKYDIVRNL